MGLYRFSLNFSGGGTDHGFVPAKASDLIPQEPIYPFYLKMHVSASHEAAIFEAQSRRISHSNSSYCNKKDGSFMVRPTGAKLETLHRVVNLVKG